MERIEGDDENAESKGAEEEAAEEEQGGGGGGMPLTRMRPLPDDQRPANARSRDDFPQPLGPWLKFDD